MLDLLELVSVHLMLDWRNLVYYARIWAWNFGISDGSEREYNKGDEIAWYPDGDKIVRNEYNAGTAFAFGTILVLILILLVFFFVCIFF